MLAGARAPWLDDAALAQAARLDQAEARLSGARESFHGGAFSVQPPTFPGGSGSRVAALMDQRQTFRLRCAFLRSGGKSVGLAPE